MDGLESLFSAFPGVAAYSKTRFFDALPDVTVLVPSSLPVRLHGSVSKEWNVLKGSEARMPCTLLAKGLLRVVHGDVPTDTFDLLRA